MGSNSNSFNNLGGLSLPNSMGTLAHTDSMNSMNRIDSMSVMNRNDSMSSMGRNDSSMSSITRNDSMSSMTRNDSMSSMGRSDSMVKFNNPMLPMFTAEENFNPSEKEKLAITYEWVGTFILPQLVYEMYWNNNNCHTQ